MICPICGTDCDDESICVYCGQDLQEITDVAEYSACDFEEKIIGHKSKDDASIHQAIEKRRKERMRCPQCKSNDYDIHWVRENVRSRLYPYGNVFIKIIELIMHIYYSPQMKRKQYRCCVCGYKWES